MLNSKKYYEQLNLTRSSIKNKLFEINKECKEFKFQQSLQIELTKKMNLLKTKSSQTHGSIQKNYNLVIQMLMKHLIFNITAFFEELKGEQMKDQVG